MDSWIKVIVFMMDLLYYELVKSFSWRKKMKNKNSNPSTSLIVILVLMMLACGTFEPVVAPTDTPVPTPTATITLTPTNTPRPSPTPRPTKTPNLAATQRYEEFNAEAKSYFDLGYLPAINGKLVEYGDFKKEWAQLGWYNRWNLRESARNFFMSAHFKWSSAYRNADISGCGFSFAAQENGDHYAVFLDRSGVYFVVTEYYYNPFRPTHGTGRVNLGNPFDAPVEADFTLIVNGIHAYVLVNDELVGEYTLSESKAVRGTLGLTLLSGTNKDFGTRCEMTNIHIWTER